MTTKDDGKDSDQYEDQVTVTTSMSIKMWMRAKDHHVDNGDADDDSNNNTNDTIMRRPPDVRTHAKTRCDQ